MTTAQTIIEDAFSVVGLGEDGQTLPSIDAARGLRVLNRMMGRWSQMRLLFPALAQVNVPLTGAQTYTIGPTGAVVALRPIRINSATAVDAGGLELPVGMLTQGHWNGIAIKDLTGGPPCDIWYEPTLTNGTLHVYPKASGYTLRLDCQSLLTSFPTVGTTVSLPDGYEDAMVLCLGDALCSDYGMPTPSDVLRRMAGAMRAIKRANAEPLTTTHELAGIGAGSDYIIERGY